jgi:hypothetical protein
MCDLRLIERKLFSHLVRFQQGLSSQHMGQLEGRVCRRDVEMDRVKDELAMEAAIRHQAPGASGNIEIPTVDAGGTVASENRMTFADSVTKTDVLSLLAQLDVLSNRQDRDDALKELQGILDILWNECLAMSNNEQHAVHLVQQLGQEGVCCLPFFHFPLEL